MYHVSCIRHEATRSLPNKVFSRAHGEIMNGAAPIAKAQTNFSSLTMSNIGEEHHVLLKDASVSAEQQGFPTLQDITKVTVLQKGEWDRIQFQLRKKEILEEERRKRIAEKQRLYDLSQDRAKGWGNTIQVSDHM